MPAWAKKKGILGTYKDLCKNTVSVWDTGRHDLVLLRSHDAERSVSVDRS